jgi:hypothetical protein
MRACALLLLFLSSLAWGDECDQLPPPSVTVRRLETPVMLNTNYGYRTLTNLGAAPARQGHRVLGLTRGKATVKIESNTRSYIDRRGRWECASPQLTISFGFDPVTVHVAKEFPSGSCAYREIYEHEMRHVLAYEAHSVAIEKELVDALTNRFATGVIWRGPIGQSREKLQLELNERWIPYIKRAMERVEATQALIDTPEEYARIAGSCNGEVKKQIR